MADVQISSTACGGMSGTSRTDREIISFAVFLLYRARRMHAPVADALAPDAPTTPPAEEVARTALSRPDVDDD